MATGYLCYMCPLTALKKDERSLKHRLKFKLVKDPTAQGLAKKLLNRMESSSVGLVFLNPADLVIGSFIASGGFGAVVTTKFLGMECAMKVVYGDSGFDRERDAVKKLGRHPHVVRTYCHSKKNAKCYLIMEKMHMNLWEYLSLLKEENRSLSLIAAVTLMLQIGEGMKFIHNKANVAHRGLKPQNILVKLENPFSKNLSTICSVKIADFGLTKEADRTRSNQTVGTGTTDYMAPEVIKEKADDPNQAKYNPLKADVYSFAIMCSVILTGENPYRDAGIDSKLIMKKQVIAGSLRPKLPRTCPLLLATLIRKCWAGDHHERPLFPEIWRELRCIKGHLLTKILTTGAQHRTAPHAPSSIPRPASVKQGSVLGKPLVDIRQTYTLGRELGRGQSAVTYLCTHNEIGEVLACKSIAKRKMTTKEDIEDVKREVQIMHHLSGNPNIVELKGVYEDKHFVHIVMEFCAGGELFDRIIGKGHYSERAAADLCRAILNVVHRCDSLGVFHRDLKPENFLLANEAEDAPLKATNFGLSTFFKRGEVFRDIMGSDYYVAPEVLQRSYGPEADLWSAGVILNILLCGMPPFWAETEHGIFDTVLEGRIDFEADPWPKISSGAKDLVKRMLNPDVKKRLTTQQVLDHPWMKMGGDASDEPLDNAVLTRLKSFAAANKMKKLALKVIAESLSEDEIVGLRELFKSFDTDNSGTVTLQELKEGLVRQASKTQGSTLRVSDTEEVVEAVDFNMDGKIDFQEFILAAMHVNRMEKEDRLFAAFHYFDTDDSGYITMNELQRALGKNGMGDLATIDEIMREVDTDNDGRVDYEEFVAMMQNGNPDSGDATDKLNKSRW